VGDGQKSQAATPYKAGGPAPAAGHVSGPWARFFVQNVQDPFAKRVQGLFDPITEARKAGTLTYEQASQALAQFNTEVADLTQSQTEFEALGGTQKLVAQQSRDTLNPLIDQWRADLQAHVASFPTPPEPKPITPEDAPTSISVLANEGVTPLQKAQGAAEQQRKRALGGGRQSTILAGVGVGLGKPERGKTLLGY
jgi:hypothetical protein